jgi:transcriptional regulator with XRE-family HTH domain
MRSPHTILPMTQEQLEDIARSRVRALRTARGLSLDQLADLTNMSPSTLSRLETGRRRLAIDHLATLARALGTTVDELLADEREEDVVIRPRRDSAGRSTFWSLTDPEEGSGRVVVKLRIPQFERLPESRVHPGRDWFYVLKGTLRLQLGDREVLVRSGQAASFDTMTPHSLGGHGGPVEILSILDHHGERAHLRG